MALAFAVVIAPNAWWLVEYDFMPFRYVDMRAQLSVHWYDVIAFPLRWIGSQVLFLLPAIELVILLYGRDVRRQPAPDESAAFARRTVTALALGPFVVTTLVAAVLGRLAVAMWGYPLWSFAPLAALMWAGPVTDARRLRWFAAGFLAVFAGFRPSTRWSSRSNRLCATVPRRRSFRAGSWPRRSRANGVKRPVNRSSMWAARKSAPDRANSPPTTSRSTRPIARTWSCVAILH
jgi:hypothetical protein